MNYDFIFKSSNKALVAYIEEEFYEVDTSILDINQKEFDPYKIGEIRNDNFILIKIFKLNDFRFAENLEKDFRNYQNVFLEYFDVIILIKEITNIKDIIRRHFESVDYSITSQINENQPVIYFQDNILNKDAILNDLLNQSEDTNGVYYYDKIKKVFMISAFKKIPRDTFNDFSNITLISNEYEAGDTRYISKDNTILSLEDHTGRFTPVYNIESLKSYDSLNYPIYQSESATLPEDSEYSVHGGKGYSNTQSMYSAIGEAYERYCARFFGNEQVIIDSYENLKVSIKTLNPKDLVLDENYVHPYNSKNDYEWIEGYKLYTDEKFLIPANAVFFPYNKDENLMMLSQSTTGISAGRSLEECILQGILEVIERDAYSICHKSNSPGIEISIDTTTDIELLRILKDLKVKGIETHLQLLSSSYNVYVVHCVLQGANYPIFTHGSGAALNIGMAIKRAIIEAAQLRISQIQLKENVVNVEVEKNVYLQWGYGNKDYCSVFLNHAHTNKDIIYYSELENLCSGDIKDDILSIVNLLKSDGYDVYSVNLSREDSVLNCARTIIPGFQDIDNFNSRDTERLFKKIDEVSGEKNKLPMFS